jgi:hypothetical protein
MNIVKMKDSGMIVDFGDLGESQSAMISAGRFDATYHEWVVATPTYPSDPTAFRAAEYDIDPTWFWVAHLNRFCKPPRSRGMTDRAGMLALSPHIGDTVYCTTYERLFWWTGNTWQCDQTIEGINDSGAAVSEGHCLVPSSQVENGFSTTTAYGHPGIVGTTVIGGSHGAYITIATTGTWKQSVYGTLLIGESLVSYSPNGCAYGAGGPPSSTSGQFATAKEAKTISAIGNVMAQIGIVAHY